jgi:MFS family permease
MQASPAPAATPSAGYTGYVLVLILFVLTFSTTDRFIVSILVDDLKRDLGLSDRQLGWILGPSFTVVYSLSVLPLARLADRSVRRSIIAAGLFAWSLFTALTGFVNSFAQLFLARMAVGIGEASASPASQSLISDLVPPERRARGISVVSIGGVTGLALGMAGGGWVAEHYGWRWAFIAAGVPGLALGVLFRLTVREPARSGARAVPGEAGHWWSDTRALFAQSSFGWLVAAHIVATFFSTAKNSWEPAFLRRVYEMGPAAAGTWYFLITPLPAMFGIYLGGWLCDRWSRVDPRARMWVPLLSQLLSIPPLYLFFVWPHDDVVLLPRIGVELPIAFIFSAIGSVIGAAYTAPMLATAQELAPPRMRALSAAVMSLSGAALGAAFGPMAVAELSTYFAPTHGNEAVRWALVATLVVPVLGAIVCALGARSLAGDLERVRAR